MQRYVDELAPEAARLGVELGRPTWDDDDWQAKVALLIETAPAVSSFAFGCPETATISALQRSGSLVMVTVTNADEASLAVERGVDVLCAQGIEAGAHRGNFDDTAADDELTLVDLVAAIVSRHRVPIVAAGGISIRPVSKPQFAPAPLPSRPARPSSGPTSPEPAPSTRRRWSTHGSPPRR